MAGSTNENKLDFNFIIHSSQGVTVSVLTDDITIAIDKNSNIVHNWSIRDIIKLEVREHKGDSVAAIHYIEKSGTDNFTWKLKLIELRSKDGELCRKFVALVTDKIQAESQRPKKLLMFINPISGSKSGVKLYNNEVAPLFSLASIAADVIITNGPHHSSEVLQQYDLKAIDGIVCVGGDGTYTECCNGLLRRTAKDDGINIDDTSSAKFPKPFVRIGLIPAGTGQGIAQMAYGCTDCVTAVLHIITGEELQCGVFSVHNDGRLLRYATMLVCYGLFGEMIQKSESSRWLGKLRYAVHIFGSVVRKRIFEADHVSYLPWTKKSSNLETVGDATLGSKENAQEGWETVNGRRFVCINCFLIDLEAPSVLPSGASAVERQRVARESWFTPMIYLSLLNDRSTRGDLLNYFKKFATFSGNISDDVMSYHAVEAYKIRQSEADARSGLALNIDGDPFILADRDIYVRSCPGSLRVFGGPIPRRPNVAVN